MKEAKRHSEPTVDAAAKALNRFEVYAKYRDFKKFHFEQAIAFKRHLAEQKGQQSGKKLSKATLYATLTKLKRFFHWLAWQPGYKSRIQYSDAEYFNLSDKDTRVATAKRHQKALTMEQFKAWSQNLGHEKVLTTFLSYGEVACQRQGEIIRDLATPQKNMKTDAKKITAEFLRGLRRAGVDV